MKQKSENSYLIDMDTLKQVAPVIRSAAHPLRLRILDYLQHQGEPCDVGNITGCVGASQAVVSQQLRILKDQGVLSANRIGNHMYYHIANPSVLLLLDCIRSHGMCKE